MGYELCLPSSLVPAPIPATGRLGAEKGGERGDPEADGRPAALLLVERGGESRTDYIPILILMSLRHRSGLRRGWEMTLNHALYWDFKMD